MLSPLITISYSYFRSSCNHLVQVLAAQNRPQKQECRDPSQSCLRPRNIRWHQLICLPEQHGHHGGYKSKGEAGEELLDRFDKELDGVAFCPGYQLQVGSIAPPSSRRQCCLVGLELLPQLLEQPVKGS